jgi:hypothetical protein
MLPTCSVVALANRISQLQGRPGHLPICERSTRTYVHAPFANNSVTLDRWLLSVGSNFSVTPWHRASYVSMYFRCMFHPVLHVFYLDHMLHWQYTYVASVCFKYFVYFRLMLQVFYLYVSYVAIRIHIYCRCMFQMFHLSQTYVASVLSVCCICCSGYTHMLQPHISNVSPISNVCCSMCIMLLVFSLPVAICFMRFRCIFYMFHLNVARVSFRCCKSKSGVANVDLVPTYMHVHGHAGGGRCSVRSDSLGMRGGRNRQGKCGRPDSG